MVIVWRRKENMGTSGLKYRCYLFVVLIAVAVVGSSARSQVHGAQRCTRSIFAFGDSYVDIGSPIFGPPYGQTVPGFPDGRATDGRLLTDYAAYYLKTRGLPIAYSQVQANTTIPPSGVSFGVAGSGVSDLVRFLVFGNPAANFSTQVSWFEGLVKAGRITERQVKNGVYLINTGGNDFVGALVSGILANSTEEGRVALQNRVLNLTSEGVNRLTQLGARRFIFPNGFPPNCFPLLTSAVNFTTCLPPASLPSTFSVWFNGLNEIVKSLNKGRKIRAVLLDFLKVFNAVSQKAACYGFDTALSPCCTGPPPVLCGAVDAQGRPVSQVCPNPGKSFWWDSVHPSNAGWAQISALAFRGRGFTSPGPNACQALGINCDGKAPKQRC